MPALTNAHMMELIAIALGVAIVWFVTAWLLALWIEFRRRRQRYV